MLHMKNNKVLVVANDFTTVYNFRLELLEALVDKKVDVSVALPPDERNHLFTQLGCKVVDLSVSRFGTNPFQDFKTMLSILKIIKRIKPDVVLTYTAKPNIYGGMAAQLTKTPYITNVTGLGSNFEKQNLVSKIMLMLQKIAYRKARMVFFQNQSNLELFVRQKIVKRNYSLLPGSGVNLECNPYEEYPHNEVIKFITVARVRRDKGYDELFQVIDKLHNQGVAAEFHIVGWYEEEKYKSIVEEMQHKSVVFYDEVSHEHVHDLIKQCDCLIHPSHHEGMSNVVLETAAAGRPCIVSNIPGCLESVDDMRSGYHFEVKNADDLYEKVCAMMSLDIDTRREMGKAARKKVCEQFDRRLIVDRYLEIMSLKQMGEKENVLV